MKIPLTPAEIEPATFRFVAQHLNRCATAVPHSFTYSLFQDFLSNSVGRDSSVGIAARYGLDGPQTESPWKRDFLRLSKTVLGPTYPPVQRVTGLLPGGKVAGVCRTVHQPLLAPRLKKE